MEKRKWETPKLIILARSNPEEAILFACKPATDPVNSANTKKEGCRQIPEVCNSCGS